MRTVEKFAITQTEEIFSASIRLLCRYNSTSSQEDSIQRRNQTSAYFPETH